MFAAIANLARVLWNVPVMIGSFTLPGWTGALFFLGFGVVAGWALRAFYIYSDRQIIIQHSPADTDRFSPKE